MSKNTSKERPGNQPQHACATSARRSKNFYIALGICLMSVGIAGYTVYDGVNRYTGNTEDVVVSQARQEPRTQERREMTETEKAPATSKKTEARQKSSELPAVQGATQSSEPTIKSVQGSGAGKFVHPSSKEVLKKFSGENPVYSQTMNDWRTHGGTDFKADPGSDVKAITSGTVKSVYNDKIYGITAVIEHEGGFEAHYSGLADGVAVQPSDTLVAGQEIGKLGSIPGESADGPHLHLSIKKDGKLINPLDLLGQ